MKELFIWRLCFIVIATAGLIDIYIYIYIYIYCSFVSPVR